MSRTFSSLLLLTLTACGTTETTVEDENNSSTGAVAIGTDTGIGTTDTSAVAPGTSGCEIYDPVAWEGAPDCPAECPNAYTLRWVGGCAPMNTGLDLDDVRAFVRVACSASPQITHSDGPGGTYQAFADGAVMFDNSPLNQERSHEFGGQPYVSVSTNFDLAEACGPLGIPEGYSRD